MSTKHSNLDQDYISIHAYRQLEFILLMEKYNSALVYIA